MGLADIRIIATPHQCLFWPDGYRMGTCKVCGMNSGQRKEHDLLPDAWPPRNIEIPEAGRYP